jgi:hypothetical protein
MAGPGRCGLLAYGLRKRDIGQDEERHGKDGCIRLEGGAVVTTSGNPSAALVDGMAMLGLYVRQGAPWFADLRAELLSFPAGRHDDQVDALGLVGQLLDKTNAGQKPKPPDLTQRDACRPAFEEIPGDNWKTL